MYTHIAAGDSLIYVHPIYYDRIARPKFGKMIEHFSNLTYN